MKLIIVLLSLIASTSYANTIDCSSTCGCSTSMECTTNTTTVESTVVSTEKEHIYNQYYTQIETDEIIEETIINGPPTRPKPSPYPVPTNSKKPKYHCTDPTVYDAIYAGFSDGTSIAKGYYIDKNDGTTIWNNKRERFQRCLPVDLSKTDDKDKGGSGGGNKGSYSNFHRIEQHILYTVLTITDYWKETIKTDKISQELTETICKITNTPGDPGISPVPEPTTLLLFGSGLATLAFSNRRRKK